MIPRAIQENLRLIFQSAESPRMNDPVPVPLLEVALEARRAYTGSVERVGHGNTAAGVPVGGKLAAAAGGGTARRTGDAG